MTVAFIILTIAFLGLLGAFLISALANRQLQKALKFEMEEGERGRELFQRLHLEDRAEIARARAEGVARIRSLETEVANAHASLELALNASPGLYRDVQIEISPDGIAYTFQGPHEGEIVNRKATACPICDMDTLYRPDGWVEGGPLECSNPECPSNVPVGPKTVIAGKKGESGA